ncbi:hypothetical protein [Piscinibacter sakaiensis]|uniref:Uncharacterized protein n=1 Tax=Piscinibacter sakaiensis TaxID=1547922 RepID=A0A0K8P268_PISS1|nr:hypothetical protein [Piscinibacter sakaiensis]GAP36703.1 hypothetical protein ISF6_2543 [Piscinibacter sakaiensis]
MLPFAPHSPRPWLVALALACAATQSAPTQAAPNPAAALPAAPQAAARDAAAPEAAPGRPPAAGPAALPGALPPVPEPPPLALAPLPRGDTLGQAAVALGEHRIVKGAPYCADTVHESVQVLADGNRIVHADRGRLCRDGEGRTRQETERAGRRQVWLSDPVAGETWLLDPQRRTARRIGGAMPAAAAIDADGQRQLREYARQMRDWAREQAAGRTGIAPPAPPTPLPAPTAAAGPDGRPQPVTVVREVVRQRDAQGRETEQVELRVLRVDGEVVHSSITRRGGAADAAEAGRAASEAGRAAGEAGRAAGAAGRAAADAGRAAADAARAAALAARAAAVPLPPLPPLPPAVALRAAGAGPRGPGVRTPLPARDIEGQRAQGERTTWTLPAGAVGNERPIQLTREVWTSPELGLTLLSTDHDPRSGETRYRLSGLTRGEPDPALLRVPADYTVQAAPAAPQPPAPPLPVAPGAAPPAPPAPPAARG